MIDALRCFSVGWAGHWTTGRRTTGHHEQGRNESGGQAKDLQPQKVSVSELKSEVKRGFSDLFLFPQAVNH